MIKKTLLTIGIILFSIVSYSQTMAQQAEKAFAECNYMDAAQLYDLQASTTTDEAERDKLYERANKCREIAELRKKGDNAYKAENYQLALNCYTKVFKANPKDGLAKSRRDECNDIVNYVNVVVMADPESDIYIDGERVGRGSWEGRLWVKTYRFETRADSLELSVKDVTLIKGKDVEITLDEKYFGFLSVTTTPEVGAKVYVDDEYIGITPCSHDRLEVGTYVLRVEKEKYATVVDTVVIEDSMLTEMDVPMSSEVSEITISTDSQSEIYIDSKYVGKGKWIGYLTEGRYLIEARKHNHKTSSRIIYVTKGEDEYVVISNPEPLSGSLYVSSTPSNAKIYINEKYYGTTPKSITNLLVGSYKLRVEKEGYQSSHRDIAIKEKQNLEVYEKLTSGYEVTIKTERNGDEIYIDNRYVGKSPVTKSLSYGTYTVKAVRNGKSVTRNITVKEYGGDRNVVLAFEASVRVTSTSKGDKVYVDGKYMGITPLNLKLSVGKHDVEVKRGKLSDSKSIDVNTSTQSTYNFVPKKEKSVAYLKNGVDFITLNYAYTTSPQHSYGLTFGSVDNVGWFASVMSGIDFRGYTAVGKTEDMVELTGQSASSRLSAVVGLLFSSGNKNCLRLGVGFGMRTKCWEATDGNWYKYYPDSDLGADFVLGWQRNAKHMTLSVDMVTTNFKTVEVKLGLGVNWKK